MQKEQLEHVSCNLCGSNSYKKLFTVKGKSRFSYPVPLTYVKCNNCSLVYTNPRPAMEKIKEQYESEFYHSKIPINSKKYIKKILNTNLNKLIFIEKYKKQGALLDIGCAQGFLLYIARLRGWETYGVEISKRTSEIAKQNFKLNVFNGTLSNAHLSPDSFDAITAFNLIEHLDNPKKFLADCRKLLKKDGILLIETPSLDSLHYLLLGKKWEIASDPGQHLYLFSKKTLKKLVENAGFKIRTIKQKATWNSIFAKTSVNENTVRHIAGLIFRLVSKLLNKEAMLVLVCTKK